jgi:hypothetical protein
MDSGYHIVTVRVIWISWAHVWRLRSLFLGMGYYSRSDQLPLVSAGTSASVTPHSSVASTLVSFRASDTTLALHCYRGTIGWSLLKISSLYCSESYSFFSRARICYNFLFWVCVKPLGHQLSWWYLGFGLLGLASWSFSCNWKDPELLPTWARVEPFMITSPWKQSPITTSLFPILITSLATLLCTSPPRGIDYSTFSFPFVEQFCNTDSCSTPYSIDLTGSPGRSNWSAFWSIFFSGPDWLGHNRSCTGSFNLLNIDHWGAPSQDEGMRMILNNDRSGNTRVLDSSLVKLTTSKQL